MPRNEREVGDAYFYVHTEAAGSNVNSSRESISATQDRDEGVSVSRFGTKGGDMI